MTLNQAKKKLDKYYEKALNSPYVKKKLAWAIFQVWREADREADKEKEGK